MCPPGLHITLGIFYRLWTLLEQACHHLDLELAKRSAPLSLDKVSFKEYGEVVKKLANMEEEKHELSFYTVSLNSHIVQLSNQLPNPENHPLITALQQESNRATKKLHEVVNYRTSYALHTHYIMHI